MPISPQALVFILVGIVALIWALYSDRRMWSSKPRSELIGMMASDEWRYWKAALRELKRRGEDITWFIPRLLVGLSADSRIAREAARITLVDVFPHLKPELKGYSSTDEPARQKATVEALIARHRRLETSGSTGDAGTADSMSDRLFEVTDDSGFLALVDPDAYETFVSKDWTLDQLLAHFEEQMRRRRLLIWGTGAEEIWRIRVRRGPSATPSFRETSGGIEASKGRLLLTNYESLTMAAAHEDTKLPLDHESDQIIDVEPSAYNCHIKQLDDPESEDESDSDEDWIIELERTETLDPVWPEIPWSPLTP